MLCFIIILESHFHGIKSVQRLIRNQITSYKGTYRFCEYCLASFYSVNKYINHNCYKFNRRNRNKVEKKKIFPQENSYLMYNDHLKEFAMEFICTGDIETIIEGALKQHTASMIGYYLICKYKPLLNCYNSFFGPTCIKNFLKHF